MNWNCSPPIIPRRIYHNEDQFPVHNGSGVLRVQPMSIKAWAVQLKQTSSLELAKPKK